MAEGIFLSPDDDEVVAVVVLFFDASSLDGDDEGNTRHDSVALWSPTRARVTGMGAESIDMLLLLLLVSESVVMLELASLRLLFSNTE